MPVYTYIYDDEPDPKPFEVFHSMREAPLREYQGRPVQRYFGPGSYVPGLGGGARSWRPEEGTSIAFRFKVDDELLSNVPALKGSLTSDGRPVSRDDSHDRTWKKQWADWQQRLAASEREKMEPTLKQQRRAREQARREAREAIREWIRGKRRGARADRRARPA